MAVVRSGNGAGAVGAVGATDAAEDRADLAADAIRTSTHTRQPIAWPVTECFNARMLASRILIIVLTCAVACTPSIATPSPTPEPTPSPTPSPTPTPVPSPTTTEPTAYFKTIVGYEWVVPPPEVDRAMGTVFANPDVAQYATGYSLRLVTHGGDPANMFLLVLALNPSYAALPGVLDSVGAGFSKSAPKVLTVAGRRALFYETSPKTMLWAHRAFVLALYGQDEATMSSFAALVITANQ